MATQGAWTILNLAKFKTLTDVIDCGSDAFNVALCSIAQALTPAFLGTSNNAQYSDLNDELATANGYTVGGQALSGVSFALGGATVEFDAATVSWTLTGGGITFKYAVIYDNTSPNKDILAYCDMDTGGGSVSPAAGTLELQMSPSGILTWS